MISEAFVRALARYTRLRLRLIDASAEDVGYAVLFYPLVGLLLGGCLVLLMVVAPSGGAVAAGLLLAARVLLGASGVYIGAGRCLGAWLTPVEERAAGNGAVAPAGGLVLVTVLLVQLSAYIDLLASGAMSSVLVAPVLALTAASALFYTTPCIDGDGPAAAMARQLPRRDLGRLLLMVGVLAGLIGPLRLLLVAVAALFLARWYLRRRDGGFTEDAESAVVILVETAVLAAAAF